LVRIDIEDLEHAELAPFRSVLRPRELEQRGQFIVEGRLLLERAIRALPSFAQAVLVTPAAYSALGSILEQLPVAVRVWCCPAPVLAAVTGVQFHQGCLGLWQRPPRLPPQALLSQVRRLVIVEGVANPDNLGSVFRNLRAFGADGALLGPACADAWYRKTLRAAMGAVFELPHARVDNVSDYLEILDSLGRVGWRLLALTPGVHNTPLEQLPVPREPWALLVGAEGPGLTSDTLQSATDRVRISMAPGQDSLNLAVAVGVALHWLHVRAAG
jgi:tRNA G18 (ribose-2'-O)-methylase SpoU